MAEGWGKLKMTDDEKVADWCRWYAAGPASYKAHALHAVWVNDRPLFSTVVQRLALTLEGLMGAMSEQEPEKVLQTKQRRHAK